MLPTFPFLDRRCRFVDLENRSRTLQKGLLGCRKTRRCPRWKKRCMGCAGSKAAEAPPVLVAGPVVATVTPATIPAASTQELEQQRLPVAPRIHRGTDDGLHQVLSPSAPPPVPPTRIRKRSRRKPTGSQHGDDIGDLAEIDDVMSPMDANDGRAPMVAVGAPRMWKAASSFLVPAPRAFGPKAKARPVIQAC